MPGYNWAAREDPQASLVDLPVIVLPSKALRFILSNTAIFDTTFQVGQMPKYSRVIEREEVHACIDLHHEWTK